MKFPYVQAYLWMYCLNTFKYIQVAHQTSTGPVVTTPKCSLSCYLHRKIHLKLLELSRKAPWKVPMTQQCRTLGAFPSGCWPCWSSFSLLVCEHFNETKKFGRKGSCLRSCCNLWSSLDMFLFVKSVLFSLKGKLRTKRWLLPDLTFVPKVSGNWQINNWEVWYEWHQHWLPLQSFLPSMGSYTMISKIWAELWLLVVVHCSKSDVNRLWMDDR